MGKFDEYNINLKGMEADSAEYNFQLGNLFFAHIDGPEVQKGNVNVQVTVHRKAGVYELLFHLEGYAIVPCDRCLDEMEQPITANEKLKVKLGEKFSEEGTDIVVVPESEGAINVAWFLYEFIALAIPMKHVHPAGKCNKAMSSSLHKHLVTDVESDNEGGGIEMEPTGEEEVEETPYEDNTDEESVDPRWNELKKLKK
jgi:uncharacterized metal-binding protein YceD (DUF177 family)